MHISLLFLADIALCSLNDTTDPPSNFDYYGFFTKSGPSGSKSARGERSSSGKINKIPNLAITRNISDGYNTSKITIIREKNKKLDESKSQSHRVKLPRPKSPRKLQSSHESVPKIEWAELMSHLNESYPNLIIRCDWTQLSKTSRKLLNVMVRERQLVFAALFMTQHEYVKKIIKSEDFPHNLYDVLTKTLDIPDFDRFIQQEFLEAFTQADVFKFESRMKRVVEALLIWSEHNKLTKDTHKDAMMFIIKELANSPRHSSRVLRLIQSKYSKDSNVVPFTDVTFNSYDEVLSYIRGLMYTDLMGRIGHVIPGLDVDFLERRLKDLSLNIIGKLVEAGNLELEPERLMFWIGWSSRLSEDTQFMDLNSIAHMFCYNYPCGFYQLEECKVIREICNVDPDLISKAILKWHRDDMVLISPSPNVNQGMGWIPRLRTIFDDLMVLDQHTAWWALINVMELNHRAVGTECSKRRSYLEAVSILEEYRKQINHN